MLGAAPAEATTRGALVRRSLVGVAIAAVLAILYAPAALFVWNAWTNDPYYTHGLLVALIAVGLAVWRLRAAPASDAPLWALSGLPVAGAIYVGGFLKHDPYALVWSALALAAAIVLATGGVARVRTLAAPFLLVALTLPIPWILEVGVALQQMALSLSSRALALVGVALQTGLTTFTVGDVTFDVTPACSGLQSAVSLLAVGAVIATVLPMSRRRAALVLALAVPLALLLNVGRILAVVAIALRWGSGAAEGFLHGLSSALIFLVETAALLAIALASGRRKEAAPRA